MVQGIHVDCEQYGAQHGDIQKYVRELLFGLTSNIQVIRENQTYIRTYIERLKEPTAEVVKEETIRPETHAMSTQTITEQPTENFMVIQSMNVDGETIQIYNMPSSHREGKDDDRNVIVEAKYVRGHSGEPKRASELVLKNVPKHFETTFVEPDETTTEIIVDPDGSKRIIVRKLTKTSQQIIQRQNYEDEALPDRVRSQLGLSGTTHDVIVGSPDHQFEQHTGITESSLHAVIEHVSHRIIKKTRKIIKKIVIIDGQEHITEEIIEEPDEVEEFSEERPAIEYEETLGVPLVIKDVTSKETSAEEITTQPIEKVANETEQIALVKNIPQGVPENISEVIDTIEKNYEPLEHEKKIVEEPNIEVRMEDKESENIDDTEKVTNKPEMPTKTEGEIQPEQVLEIITEAPVELIASEVDKLAPIEDISNIWPYETPHIATQTTSTEVIELPAAIHQDKDSLDIWPQNLKIGSNLDFNEYSFDRTLEKSSDYLDNDSFVVDSGLILNASEETSNIENSLAEKETEEALIVDQIEESVKQPEIDINENTPITETEFVDEAVLLVPQITEKTTAETLKTSDSPTKVSTEEPTENPLKKSKIEDIRPSSPPQMATITIVKTMTFLEQERINSESVMIVTKEPITEAPLNNTQTEILALINEKTEVPENSDKLENVEIILDTSTVSQTDRSWTEEIVKQTIDKVLFEDVEIDGTTLISPRIPSSLETIEKELCEMTSENEEDLQNIIEVEQQLVTRTEVHELSELNTKPNKQQPPQQSEQAVIEKVYSNVSFDGKIFSHSIYFLLG